jgi:tetratricopeptide (TPR) repeat protein
MVKKSKFSSLPINRDNEILERANQLLHDKKPEQAIELFFSLLTIDNSQNVSVLNGLGNAYLQAGRFIDAFSCFDDIAIAGDLELSGICKANLLCDVGFPEAANNVLDEFSLQSPPSEAHLIVKARVLRALGKAAESIRFYERIIEMDSNSAFGHEGKGHALLQLRDYEAALAAFNDALCHNPDNPILLENQAQTLLRLDRHSEAVKAAERLVAVSPQRAESWYVRGLIVANNYDPDLARTSFLRCLKIDPDFKSASAALKRLGKARSLLKTEAAGWWVQPLEGGDLKVIKWKEHQVFYSSESGFATYGAVGDFPDPKKYKVIASYQSHPHPEDDFLSAIDMILAITCRRYYGYDVPIILSVPASHDFESDPKMIILFFTFLNDADDEALYEDIREVVQMDSDDTAILRKLNRRFFFKTDMTATFSGASPEG